ncbi:MAG: hypothetical protein K5872_16555 [Rhizobiaceae bacterium]|nr:hypothetical protein [Rhizobiaceae bacterium]MCV0407834.1 hypothetical protein [Rhizobiaceae bacterium]
MRSDARRQDVTLPGTADRLVAGLLVLTHAVLLAWAAAGLVEMAWIDTPWPPISNPLFSNAMLLLQWLVVAGAALTFLFGFARRWPRLREVMTGWYLVMAAICAWQTFFTLESEWRFAAMALEYAAYAGIILYLHRSTYMRERLSGTPG